jgi:hypothetical protein
MSMFPAPLVCGVGGGLRGCEETTFQTECGQLLDSICANCELEAGSWLMMGWHAEAWIMIIMKGF